MADTIAERNAVNNGKANEQALLDQQKAELDKQIAEFGEEKALGDFAKSLGFKSPKDLQSLVDRINAEPDNSEKSRILADELKVLMPIWFKDQRDNSLVPSGLTKFDEAVPLETVENGSVRMNYNAPAYKPDGKGVYYGSMKNDDGKSWVEMTQGNAPVADYEDWVTKITIHMMAMQFLPLFTNAHKSVELFMLQLSNLKVNWTQPLQVLMFGIRGKMLLDPANAFDNIESTDEAITIKPTTYPKPDIEIKATTFHALISKLNTKVQEWTSASTKHYPDDSESGKMMLINGGKNIKGQLLRSLPASLDDIEIWTSNKFINIYNNYQLRGSFQKDEASFLAAFRKAFHLVNPELDFAPEYANVTGFMDTMDADDDDNIAGSVDMVIKTKGFMSLINQFNSDNDFDTPVHTRVKNGWFDLGPKLKKKPDQFYMRVRLTVTPKTAPAE